jgi:hypothetical protein
MDAGTTAFFHLGQSPSLLVSLQAADPEGSAMKTVISFVVDHHPKF